MADTEKLRDLLREMERARSPLQRLRLVALAWRTVRGLSQEEREGLALKVGMAEAGELVERLAAKDGGVAPTELLEAIHAAETTDPGKLRRLATGIRGVIRDPEQRRGLLHRAVEALDAAAEAALPAAATTVVAEQITPPEGLPRPQPAEVAAAPAPEPAPAPRPASAPAPRAKPAPPPRTTPAAARPLPARPSTPAPPSPPAPPARSDESAGFESPFEAPPRATRRDLVERLSALRRRAALLRGEGLDRLRQELHDLPPGWARRRALCALLEEGLPVTTDGALGLIADLPAERDRAWCLAALLARREVARQELETALELVSSSAARRRLRRLAATGAAGE